MYDLNDAEPQRGGVIEPCYAKIIGTLRPGGANGPAPADHGLLKPSKQTGSDVLMLDWEFTIVEGRNARRKFWQTMTVSGGEVDEKGQSKGWNITKSTLRAMIDSALGLNPKDESDGARQRRQLPSFSALSGITFIGKIGIKKDKDSKYPDQNILAHVVTPDEKEWQAVMSGQEVVVGNGAAQIQGWPGNQPAAPAQASLWGGAAPAAPAAPQFGWPGAANAHPQQPPAPAAPVAPAAAPGWPAPQPAGWPPAQPAAAPPAPAAGYPASQPAGWPAQQPAGWPPAAAPTGAPAAAAAAPMGGPSWLNG